MVPVALVGVMTYDGKGGGVLTSTLSINGAISKGTLSATYAVNSDCTMTQTMSNGTNYAGPVAADGRWVRFRIRRRVGASIERKDGGRRTVGQSI